MTLTKSAYFTYSSSHLPIHADIWNDLVQTALRIKLSTEIIYIFQSKKHRPFKSKG